MDLAQKSDEEILAVAGPITDNLMKASTTIDAAKPKHRIAMEAHGH